MKNLFPYCALTHKKFENKDSIVVIPVTTILDKPTEIYLGTPFISTFEKENPLQFDSLSMNKDYKSVISVLKSYMEQAENISNKAPLEVASYLSNNTTILHNKNNLTGSLHPWQKHELNYIFIKLDAYLEQKAIFEKQAQSVAEVCLGAFSKNPISKIFKIEVNTLLSKINYPSNEHLKHVNIHFLRNFYIQHIFNQEKENLIKLNQVNYEQLVADFKELMLMNSLYPTITNSYKDTYKNNSLKDAA